MNRKARRAKGRKISNSDYEQARSIANLLRSIITEVEAFINQIIQDNFDKELVDNLFLKVHMPFKGYIINIEIFNKLTNTTVVYDMTIEELLKFCVSKTLESLMNDKIPKMVLKSQQYKKGESTNRVCLEHSI